jgi:hypothetical protein
MLYFVPYILHTMLQLERFSLAAALQDFLNKGMRMLRLRLPSVRQSVNKHMAQMPDFQKKKNQCRSNLQNVVEQGCVL